MPCYLFTYHTHGSWLPDRPRGYVRRHEGILPQDKRLAQLYRELMKQGEVSIGEEVQLIVIETLLEAATRVDCRPHSIATDDQHIHLLVSWHDENRGWEQTRSSFKKAVTIKLKASHTDQKWLSRGASRKRVKEQLHFDRLVNSYLPDHRGWKWDERVGFFLTKDEFTRGRSDEA